MAVDGERVWGTFQSLTAGTKMSQSHRLVMERLFSSTEEKHRFCIIFQHLDTAGTGRGCRRE